MKTTMKWLPLFLLLLTPTRLRAQGLDAATDAPSDAASIADASRSDAASGAGGAGGAGGASGAKDGGTHDAAAPPPINFFLNESPGCAFGGALDPSTGALSGVALGAFALGRRRRTRA